MATRTAVHYSDLEVLASANSSNNQYFSDVIGNKSDSASNTTGTASLIALLRYVIANLSSDTDIAALIGELTTNSHTGDVDTVTTLIGYIKQLVTDERALSTIIGTPVTSVSTDIATIKTVVDLIKGYTDTEIAAIKAIIDLLPDAGALTSLAQANVIGNPTDTSISQDIVNLQTTATTINDLVTTNDNTNTYSYTDSGLEQTVLEITNTKRKTINAIWVDTVNLTNNGTFKVYYKVDGTNYRIVSSTTIDYTLDKAYNLIDRPTAITNDIKITYTEASDEGATRDIVYSTIYEINE